jgi:prepilin-type processing-associated H-X9-DG protein
MKCPSHPAKVEYSPTVNFWGDNKWGGVVLMNYAYLGGLTYERFNNPPNPGSYSATNFSTDYVPAVTTSDPDLTRRILALDEVFWNLTGNQSWPNNSYPAGFRTGHTTRNGNAPAVVNLLFADGHVESQRGLGSDNAPVDTTTWRLNHCAACGGPWFYW